MLDGDQATAFADLPTADLHVERRYLGGTRGTSGDDPLARLLPVGNQGGFRYKGSVRNDSVKLAVLYTSGEELTWPDSLDPETGIFTYFGDNRRPGTELHDTTRAGNLLLRNAFERAHGSADDRLRVPPFLYFEKSVPGRAVRFRGLLAPGAATLTSDADLSAIWRNASGSRFQNYRAFFTVLDVGVVPRDWLDAVLSGAPTISAGCPEPWRDWVEGRVYRALVAPPTVTIRSKADQLPSDPTGRAILQTIRDYFSTRPTDFEACAVEVWRLMAPSTGSCTVTSPSRDGGRDAIGQYLLGPNADKVSVEFALEAKCYGQDSGVGVREMSRLISRIRHRQFGVFVTLSYFNRQVYDEVRTDGHPIAMVCGRDVVDVLRDNGFSDRAAVQAWLNSRFPGVTD
ncbi:restriction endonuclease [Nocardia altamirensis]|uniref:restriction endonuclease n=1 Tax=Nocardia altamirensis TaxID=472158 RepID=UPI0008405D82|nr:restriction endonuclease [Nocardia altamirensis]